MSEQWEYKKVAVLCILEHDNQFLLLKRRKAPNIGLYTPVGGKLHPFESPEQAAYRETMEETGIEVENFRYWGSLVETSPADYNWVSFVYHAEVEYCEPIDCSEGTLKWIDQIDLRKLKAPDTDWHLYQYILLKKPFAIHAEYNQQLQLMQMKEMIEGKDLLKKQV